MSEFDPMHDQRRAAIAASDEAYRHDDYEGIPPELRFEASRAAEENADLAFSMGFEFEEAVFAAAEGLRDYIDG